MSVKAAMQDLLLVNQARAIIKRGSKSFAAATKLFAPAIRDDVILLYAWCRHCDDLTDGQEFGHGFISTASAETLQRMRSDSLSAVAGNPSDHLPYLALSELAKRYPINRILVEDHIRGFEMDVQGWQPQTLKDTLTYCYHVAGVVGIMMARLMGVQDAATLHRANDLGIAFQLTNIARDVVEDAMAGRSYLPREWLIDSNLTIEDLAKPSQHERVYPLVQRLIRESEPYYDSAMIGIRELPTRAAWAVASARLIYQDIGKILLERGPVVLSQRVFTKKSQKLWRMLESLPGVLANQAPPTRNAREGLWTPTSVT
ncbi:MAG: phytoene/squalene synthase family protein [Pseudomonadota bacterium]